jgi:DNA-binding SARP family transcriptional activator
VVDAERVERLVARAPREALALWRGWPLDDAAEDPFAGPEIRRLEELRLGVQELAIEHDVNDGRHLDVVAELEALVAAEPLRERAHAQRMPALYRSGRPGQCARGLPQAHAALIDAIGVEPAAELHPDPPGSVARAAGSSPLFLVPARGEARPRDPRTSPHIRADAAVAGSRAALRRAA